MSDTLENPAELSQTLARIAVESKTRAVWLRMGTLIDGISASPLRDAHLVFNAKEVLYAGTDHGLAASVASIVAPDATLDQITALPTLIEAHAHAFLEGAPVDFAQREQYLKEPPEEFLKRAKARRSKLLSIGVGAMRDAGDKHGVGLALAAEEKSERGTLRSVPYIDSPGAAIYHKGRYGAFMGQPIEDHASAAACVASRVSEGADRIKLLVSGIINFKAGQVTTPPQMPIDEVRAIVEAAKSHGKQTFAHASGTEGVEHSIEGGVTTVEHGFFITEEQLKKMRDRNIAWVPTFAPVQLQIDRASELGWDDSVVTNLKKIIDSHQKMLVKAEQLGVTVVAGSDAGSCGVPHGLGLLDELAQMEAAGMSTMNVLRAATGVSAQTLDFPELIGRLAKGCRSRMIFTSHDPLATVKNLSRSKAILFDGFLVNVQRDVDPQGL